ncbi:MAG TPA: hypothetical protein VJ760_07500 [Nitrospiraceae bacterium]|nr:hypothetical protein [Nitrospiraceae bacterium]
MPCASRLVGLIYLGKRDQPEKPDESGTPKSEEGASLTISQRVDKVGL